MSRQFPGLPAITHFCAAAIGLIALSGCEQLQGGAAGGETVSESGVLRIEEREVERPDIFEMNARGLWDGRPSLGGRWVAVSRDIDAETVLIVNKSNNQQIKGALFKLAAERPGPPILVSSEAAEALNMTAGTPAEMRIVALRTETVEIAADAPAEPAAEEGVVDGEVDAAVAAAAAAEGGGEGEGEVPTGPVPEGELETTVLDALDSAEAAPVAPPAASGSAPSQPFLQAASGGNRQGADAALARITGAGLPGTVRTAGTEQRPVYRVVAGPFPDSASRSAALAKLKELGFSDAFPVR